MKIFEKFMRAVMINCEFSLPGLTIPCTGKRVGASSVWPGT